MNSLVTTRTEIETVCWPHYCSSHFEYSSSLDFLDDAEEVESLLPKPKSFALPEQRPRADALFQHIETKYSTNSADSERLPNTLLLGDDHPLVLHVLHSSQTNDWPTWSLKCRVCIRTIVLCMCASNRFAKDPYPVLYELQRCHERLKPQLRSAYMNPGSPGYIYLEALFLHHYKPDPLRTALGQFSSIRMATLTRVPPNELRKTLTVPQSSCTINFIPGQWVQVK